MDPTYSSGNPRVHAGSSEHSIRAAIEEYENYARMHHDELATDLMETAIDLREELKIREDEERAQLEDARDRADEIRRDLAEDERRDELRDYQSSDQFTAQQHRRDTLGRMDS